MGARPAKESSPLVLSLTRGITKQFQLDDLRGWPVM